MPAYRGSLRRAAKGGGGGVEGHASERTQGTADKGLAMLDALVLAAGKALGVTDAK